MNLLLKNKTKTILSDSVSSDGENGTISLRHLDSGRIHVYKKESSTSSSDLDNVNTNSWYVKSHKLCSRKLSEINMQSISLGMFD
jgi:hypothetical protein